MDVFLLVFAATLVVAVLFSALAKRTILSAAVLFLAVGFFIGPETTGVLQLTATSPEVSTIAELALFVVLYTDGMRLGWKDLRSAWRLPGRALGWGLPLTLAITAALAHYIVGLDWASSLLIGAILAPTDPVFAAALVGNDRVPHRLRHLLNVESGVNDGLALPFVVVFLAISSGSQDLHLGELAFELVLGTAIGIVVPLAVIYALRTRLFSAAGVFLPLVPISIGILVFALATYTNGNLFLASFAAGVTVATVGPEDRAAFAEFGEIISELLKLLALMVFGALLSWQFFGEIAWTGWVFAVLALVLARPAALGLSFLGSGLSMREQLAAMWFGPKGFASVVYVLLVVSTGIPNGDLIFHLVAITIALSIVAHSSTDVVVARAFDDPSDVPAWDDSKQLRAAERGAKSSGGAQKGSTRKP